MAARKRVAMHFLAARLVVRRHTVLVAVSMISVLSVAAAAYTVIPRQAVFAFSNPTACIGKFIVLPGLQRPVGNSVYNVQLRNNISILGYSLASRQTCITPQAAPSENATETVKFSLLGNRLFANSIKVSAAGYPKLNTHKMTNPISAHQPLVLPFDDSDKLFVYEIQANDHTANCNKDNKMLSCPVEKFNFKQGGEYDLSIVRKYQDSTVNTIYQGSVKTAEPVEIAEANISNGKTVYKPLQEIKLKTNKPLANYEEITLHQKTDSGEQTTDTEVVLNGQSVVIKAEEPLPRRVNFVLRVKDLESEYGGRLDKPVKISFTTSGGPAVKGVNLATYAVDTNQQIRISFDQNIDPDLALASIVSFKRSGNSVPFKARIEGASIVLSGYSLARCTSYNLYINENIASKYGIKGDSEWGYKFRTRCASISTIGYSVKGRAISAYKFGSGSSKVVYVGTMHGTEASGYYTLNSWIDELERNHHKIPEHRSIIVIPNSNPDGKVAGSRTNANGVDLNRNFPTDDWTEDIYMPGPTHVPDGGGSAPLSEPESAALAEYVQAQSPRLVLTYHSSAAVVIGNGSGDSAGLASQYAAKAGYSVGSDGEADGIFGYATTGEFEDWLHDKLGIPALLVELPGSYGNYFSRDLDALWHTATIK